MEHQTCPAYKAEATLDATACPNCFYPFNGTQKEKAVFIAEQIRNKSKVKEAKNGIKTTQIALIVLASIHFLGLLIIRDITLLIIQMVFTALFIICAVAVKTRPVSSLVTVVSVLGAFYLFLFLFAPDAFISGVLWKIITMFVLAYALNAVLAARKAEKISPYLAQQSVETKKKPKVDEELLDL